MSNNMLTIEEQPHKDQMISLTEQVLHAKGLECDSQISKISEEQLREILDGVRRLRKREKKIDKSPPRRERFEYQHPTFPYSTVR
jgi:hypothetical protein